LSISTSAAPAINGGGETGEEWDSVAWRASSLKHMALFPMSFNVISAGSPSGAFNLRTVFPANSSSSSEQFRYSAAFFNIFFFSDSQVFTTAIPVKYAVLEA
jgi:hypothetical protein